MGRLLTLTLLTLLTLSTSAQFDIDESKIIKSPLAKSNVFDRSIMVFIQEDEILRVDTNVSINKDGLKTVSHKTTRHSFHFKATTTKWYFWVDKGNIFNEYTDLEIDEKYNKLMFKFINVYRVKNNRSKLKYDKEFQSISNENAMEVSQYHRYILLHVKRKDTNKYSENGHRGGGPNLTINEKSFKGFVVKYYGSKSYEKQLLDDKLRHTFLSIYGWHNSPGHKKNMLNKNHTMLSGSSVFHKEDNVIEDLVGISIFR